MVNIILCSFIQTADWYTMNHKAEIGGTPFKIGGAATRICGLVIQNNTAD